MSDMSVNLSMGGAFYRASQNTQKVNKAVNMMLNRVETGQKYQSWPPERTMKSQRRPRD